eukprot:497582_1
MDNQIFVILTIIAINLLVKSWEMDNIFVAFNDINGIDFLNSNYSNFKVIVAPSAMKYSGNPVLIADKPWEAGTLDNGYANIVVNENRTQWQLWYQAFFYVGNEALKNTGVLYAESKDGINWTKPNLNIVNINGSTANNAICRDCHGWGVWQDSQYNNAYKAIGAYDYKNNCDSSSDCTIMAISKDGIHWTNFTQPKMGNRFDTHNIMFLDPKSNKYIVWTRSEEFPPRIIARSEGDSSDFLHSKYSQVTNVNQGITMNDQLHDQIVMPFHSVYIGFITVFETENPDETTDCALVWSLDTKEWFRLGAYHDKDANIIQRNVHSKDFDSHLCFAGLFPVDMNENITRFYYTGANNTFFPGNPGRQTSMGFANIRKDGWAGLTNTNPQQIANLISHSFSVNGNNLIITIDVYNTPISGSVRVGFKGINNYGVSDCEYIRANVTNYVVKWKSGSDISSLKGKKVQLQIELNNAVLYTYGTVQK